MPVAPLSEVSILLPRSELPQLLRELGEFRHFHPSRQEARDIDPQLDALRDRALRLLVELEDIAKELGLVEERGVIDVLLHGYKEERERRSVKDWEELLEGLEREAGPLIQELKTRLGEVDGARKRLGELEGLASTLLLISRFSIDLSELPRLRRFVAIFAAINAKDLPELERSLPQAFLASEPLGRGESAVLLVAPKVEEERIDRVLRSFEVRPFSIPAHLPQSPKEAHSIVVKELDELRLKLKELEAGLKRLVEREGRRILALKELAHISHQVLEDMKRAGSLRYLALVRGYIPSDMKREFGARFSRWMLVIEEAKGEHHEAAELKGGEGEVREGRGGEEARPIPSLLRNWGYFKPFEKITLTQGPPSYGELDPTFLISLIFPIFYGMMFGDLGHGLILMGFGAFLIKRGTPKIREWGIIFLAAGASAAVMGMIIGEAFGFPTYSLLPMFKGFVMVELVERLNGASTINVEALMTMIVASIMLGIFQITLGLILNVVNALRAKEYAEALAERIPALTLYIFGVLFALAFIGAENNFARLLTSDAPTPLLGLPVKLVGLVSVIGSLASLLALIFGRGIAMLLGLLPREGGVGMTIFQSFIEALFERIAGYLANTVSYARIAVLLTVHASLLMVLNLSLALPLAVAMPMLLLFNILIIVLEGLIVYIQDLRLHLYEWFSKFYKGTGIPFRSLIPETTHVVLEWER